MSAYDNLSTEDRIMLVACEHNEIQIPVSGWKRVEHHFTWGGVLIDPDMTRRLESLVDRGFLLAQAPWVLVTDAGQEALA